MPGCAGRRGSGLGTSSRRSNERDSVFRAALITGIRRLGDHFSLEMPDENERCDSLRRVYKRCVIAESINCDYYAKELTKICPGFNDEEFLRAVSSSKEMRDSENSVFRAALIRGIRRLGDYFGLEMPDENERCDSLRRVYKRCVIAELSNCDYYAKELTKICPRFNDEEFLRAVSSSKEMRDSERKKNDGV